MTSYNSYTVKKRCPSGTIFVVINEDNNGKPCLINIYLGKTGATLFAFTNAIAELITLTLAKGGRLEDVITALSNITSDKRVYNANIPIRSDVDAIVQALLDYKRMKYDSKVRSSRPILRQV